MGIKLTLRQKTFLSKLLDLYRERQEPMHYSVVAERLGLSGSAAYDMLRLLEQKGMVSSEYSIPKESAGPGRSSIYFAPTAEAIELLSRLARGSNGEQEWENIKAHILSSLRQGKASDYQELLQELLARMPEPRSPLVRCAEVITALMLDLREARCELTETGSVTALLKVPADKLRMSRLAGLVMGLSLSKRKTGLLPGDYEGYIRKYEAALQELGHESLAALHRFTQDVWYTLNKVPES